MRIKTKAIGALPWFKFWTGHFRSKTDHLCNAEVGAYVRLLASYWDNNGLPFNERALTRIAKIEAEDDVDLGSILGEFFDLKDDALRHEELDAQRIDAIGAEDANRRRTQAARLALSEHRKSVTMPLADTDIDVDQEGDEDRESEVNRHPDGRGRSQTHIQTEDPHPPSDPHEKGESPQVAVDSGSQKPLQTSSTRDHQSVSLKPDGGAQGEAVPARSPAVSGLAAPEYTGVQRLQDRTAVVPATATDQSPVTRSAQCDEFTSKQQAEIDRHPPRSPERLAAIKQFMRAA